MLVTAAETLLHPLWRVRAIANIVLDLSLDPGKASAAYREHCFVTHGEAAELLRNFVKQMLQLPDAKAAQAEIDAEAAAAAAEAQQQALWDLESERLRKAWVKAHEAYEQFTDDNPSDDMSDGFWATYHAVNQARQEYNTFHRIGNDEESGDFESDSADDSDCDCAAA